MPRSHAARGTGRSATAALTQVPNFPSFPNFGAARNSRRSGVLARTRMRDGRGARAGACLTAFCDDVLSAQPSPPPPPESASASAPRDSLLQQRQSLDRQSLAPVEVIDVDAHGTPLKKLAPADEHCGDEVHACGRASFSVAEGPTALPPCRHIGEHTSCRTRSDCHRAPTAHALVVAEQENTPRDDKEKKVMFIAGVGYTGQRNKLPARFCTAAPSRRTRT